MGFDDLNVAEARRICREALRDRIEGWLRNEDVRSVLGAFAFPLVPGAVANSRTKRVRSLRRSAFRSWLGGIHVEVLGDVCFRIAPLTDRDVDEQLHSIKGSACCRATMGIRQQTPPPCASYPVIALPLGQGCRIVDARIRVKRTKTLGVGDVKPSTPKSLRPPA